VAAERSAELSVASDVLAAHGADELATAVAAGAVAKDAGLGLRGPPPGLKKWARARRPWWRAKPCRSAPLS